jgi:hypothetical protein
MIMYKNNLPIIKSRGGNMYSIGGNLFFMGGMGLDSVAGQFMSKNQGAIAGGAGILGQGVDTIASEGSIGGSVAKGALSGASAGMALGPWGALAGGVIGGGISAITASKEKQRMDFAKKMSDQARGDSMMSGINSQTGNVYAANGGELPGITQFNVGGTHEQNPLNGIPQGISQQNGQPNLVEQGETKVKDFVYSDRLPVIGAKEYNLPEKYEGKTFAAASKLASKYIKDRPNDPIAQKGQEVFLNRLKMANEEAKQMKEAAEQGLIPQQPQFCHGGKMKMKNIHATGGYLFTDY